MKKKKVILGSPENIERYELFCRWKCGTTIDHFYADPNEAEGELDNMCDRDDDQLIRKIFVKDTKTGKIVAGWE